MAKQLTKEYVLSHYPKFTHIDGEVYHEGEVIGVQRNALRVIEVYGLDNPIINVVCPAVVGQTVLLDWRYRWLANA